VGLSLIWRRRGPGVFDHRPAPLRAWRSGAVERDARTSPWARPNGRVRPSGSPGCRGSAISSSTARACRASSRDRSIQCATSRA